MSCPRCQHCYPTPRFRHGDRVLHAELGVGRITGRPRAGSITAYVVWPDGWAGHVLLSELKHATRAGEARGVGASKDGEE